ncbi:PKD domain-containing protein [Marinoscillum sp. MHG1-6]|uniref:CBM96 family carbohydrate-binding protein n=1 Tax=Marinoscillum sp. MHG1-6 TaxID=2959627 RepID=UPI002157FF74|nr:PKD domain-containing protein [Marinoscillum sp. MHG1-6]
MKQQLPDSGTELTSSGKGNKSQLSINFWLFFICLCAAMATYAQSTPTSSQLVEYSPQGLAGRPDLAHIGDKIYVLYTDNTTYMGCIAQYDLSNGSTTKNENLFPTIGQEDSSHNDAAIAIDGDGYIHVMIGMHNHKMRYYKSQHKHDYFADFDALEFDTLGSSMPGYNDTGIHEKFYSYPSAVTASNGDVAFILRRTGFILQQGDSQNFEKQDLYHYDLSTGQWSMTMVKGKYAVDTLPGGGNFPNAYMSRLYADDSNNIHIVTAWSWFHNGNNTFQRGTYLKFDVDQNTFHKADGTEVTDKLPIFVDDTDGSVDFFYNSGIPWRKNFLELQTPNVTVNELGYPIVSFARNWEPSLSKGADSKDPNLPDPVMFRTISAWDGYKWVLNDSLATEKAGGRPDITYTAGQLNTYSRDASSTNSTRQIAISVDGGYSWPLLVNDGGTSWIPRAIQIGPNTDAFLAGKRLMKMEYPAPDPNPVPIANFSSDLTTIYEGDSVTFKDLSTNSPTSLSWSFPEGTPSTSTSSNPAVTYATAGTYDVTLVATNGIGNDTLVKTGYITVKVDYPDTVFTVGPSDDSYVSGGGNATLNYNSETSMKVKGGTAEQDRISFVKYDISAINPDEVLSVVLKLTPVSGDSWNSSVTYVSSVSDDNWSEGTLNYNNKPETGLPITSVSNSTGATIEEFNITDKFKSELDGTLTLAISSSIPSGSAGRFYTKEHGDSTAWPVLVITSEPPVETGSAPQAEFSADVASVIEGGEVIFTDMSANTPTTWDWSFPGGTPSSSTAPNPSVTYDTPGIYDVTLTVTNAQGTNAQTKSDLIKVYYDISDTTLAFEPISDSYVSGGINADTIYGGETSMKAKNGIDVNHRYSFLKYDLSLIHPDSVESALLKITPVDGDTWLSSTTFVSYVANDGWEEDALTYNNMPVIGSQLDSVENSDGGEVEEFNVSSQIKTENDGVITFAISTTISNGAAARFYTKEHGVSTERPLLMISGGAIISNPPVADFSADVTSVEEGEPVTFTDLSTNNPTSWDWEFTGGTPSASTDQNPVIVYSSEGTYQVQLTATNADGSGIVTKTSYITVTAPSTGCSVVNAESFESGWGIWYDGGSDCQLINDASVAATGSYSVELRDNSSSSYMRSYDQDFSAYASAEVEFSFISTSFNNGESLILEVSNSSGSSWQHMKTWTAGTDFSNNVRVYEVVATSGITMNNTTRFKFTCEASNNGDRIYLDDIEIRGCGTSGSRTAEESASIASITSSTMEVKLYPNPAHSVMSLEMNQDWDVNSTSVSIYNLLGAKMSNYALSFEANTMKVDVSSLPQGVYLISLISGNERIEKRFVVK